MRQRQSPWISLVLYGLVLLSLFLTWRILVVPSNTFSTQGLNSSTQTSTTNTNVMNIEDFFAPHQMAVHSNSSTYVTQNTDTMKKVQKFLVNWKMNDVALSRTYSEEEYTDLLMQTGRIEVRFPTSVHLGLLTHYFESLPEELYNHRVNRMLISTDPEIPVYLVNDQNRNVYTAQRPATNIQPLITLYTENQGLFYSSNAYAFQDGLTFLPRSDFEISHLVYLVEKQPNSFFINHLFEDTTELRDDSNEFVTAYSDNISELRINKETGVLMYTRNSLDQTTIPAYQQIRNSFHSMKFIDTWTHASYFTGYDEHSREITYRRFVGGLPIFSTQERGTVRMEMSNNYLLKMQYPTEVIQTPLTDREEIFAVPSADEVIETLTLGGFSFSEIEMLELGYEWTTSEESSRIAVLVPKWFVKMEGYWRTVESWLAERKADE